MATLVPPVYQLRVRQEGGSAILFLRSCLRVHTPCPVSPVVSWPGPSWLHQAPACPIVHLGAQVRIHSSQNPLLPLPTLSSTAQLVLCSRSQRQPLWEVLPDCSLPPNNVRAGVTQTLVHVSQLPTHLVPEVSAEPRVGVPQEGQVTGFLQAVTRWVLASWDFAGDHVQGRTFQLISVP